MFGLFKKKTESEEVAKYKADNVKLLSRISTLESKLKSSEERAKQHHENHQDAERKLEEAEATIARLEKDDSQKVTYATARKTMTKDKLKKMRQSLEAIPSGATGFGGSVSVYDKKTKRLSVVQLKSKTEALEIVAKAEKGHVDIVI